MFQINIAGLTIGIENRFKAVGFVCEDYITEDGAPDFTVSVTTAELRALRDPDDPECTPAYCESLGVLGKIGRRMLQYDGLLLHGAAVAVDGETYLFLAKSGVGKSTRVQRWLEVFGARAQVVNGDKPIVRRVDGIWYACGTPWSGKEGQSTPGMFPLKALCFLERSEENTVVPMDMDEAIGRIFHQVLMPTEETEQDRFFALLEGLLTEVPCYLLRSDQSTDGVLSIYDGMQQNEF